MSGPESHTLTSAAPARTGIDSSTVPRLLSFFLNENCLRRRIWSFTATITCPSESGDSKRRRSIPVVEAEVGGDGPIGCGPKGRATGGRGGATAARRPGATGGFDL